MHFSWNCMHFHDKADRGRARGGRASCRRSPRASPGVSRRTPSTRCSCSAILWRCRRRDRQERGQRFGFLVVKPQCNLNARIFRISPSSVRKRTCNPTTTREHNCTRATTEYSTETHRPKWKGQPENVVTVGPVLLPMLELSLWHCPSFRPVVAPQRHTRGEPARGAVQSPGGRGPEPRADGPARRRRVPRAPRPVRARARRTTQEFSAFFQGSPRIFMTNRDPWCIAIYLVCLKFRTLNTFGQWTHPGGASQCVHTVLTWRVSLRLTAPPTSNPKRRS